ncbi:MAG: aldehyde ferredoxin oxidoreductase C-terminal domain-containing protein, partial [candidate division NC10 bacterium]|nr:aldehyde ferredoxin oxidoreductase C-terminal domain-containing protein [candidate division NC10 bacterium]
RGMGTIQMRTEHDTVPEWVFLDPSGSPPFAKGTIRMDREDIDLALTLFYREMGWDEASGAPTLMAYERVGLSEVGQRLAERGLLP